LGATVAVFVPSSAGLIAFCWCRRHSRSRSPAVHQVVTLRQFSSVGLVCRWFSTPYGSAGFQFAGRARGTFLVARGSAVPSNAMPGSPFCCRQVLPAVLDCLAGLRLCARHRQFCRTRADFSNAAFALLDTSRRASTLARAVPPRFLPAGSGFPGLPAVALPLVLACLPLTRVAARVALGFCLPRVGAAPPRGLPCAVCLPRAQRVPNASGHRRLALVAAPSDLVAFCLGWLPFSASMDYT